MMGRRDHPGFWDSHDPYEVLTQALLWVAFAGVVWGVLTLVA